MARHSNSAVAHLLSVGVRDLLPHVISHILLSLSLWMSAKPKPCILEASVSSSVGRVLSKFFTITSDVRNFFMASKAF